MIIERTPYNVPFIPKYQSTIEFFVWQNETFNETNKPAEFHFQLVDFLERPDKNKSVSATRGGSKSTTIGIYWILHLFYRGRKNGFNKNIKFALYLMDTATKVQSHFERFEWNILNSKAKNFFEIVKRRIGKDGCLLKLKRKSDGKIFIFAGLAMGQNIRSLNIENTRPELIIADDIENKDNTANEELRKGVRDWFFKDVEPAGILGYTEFIFIGTPLHSDALLLRQRKSDAWICCLFPLAEKMPVLNVDDIISCWEDRFSKQSIQNLYTKMKEDGEIKSFTQEYMLDVSSDESSIYELDKIKRYNPKLKNKVARNLAKYISIDLAVSENSNSHYTSIVVFGESANNDTILLDGKFGRFSIDSIIEWVFKMAFKWNIIGLIMEQVLFQKAYKWIFEQKMAEYNMFFDLLLFSRTRANMKLDVFKSFAPIVNKGKLIVPDVEEMVPQDMDVVDIRMKEFLTELIDNEMPFITNDEILAEYDDCLDSVAQITQVQLEKGELPIELNEEYNSIEYKNPYV